MICRYEGLAVEVPLHQGNIDQLFNSIKALGDQFNGLFSSMLSASPSGKEIAKIRQNQLHDWLTNAKGSFTLEIFVPKGEGTNAVVIEIRPMKHLKTEFGKRHKRKYIAYPMLYFFSDRSSLKNNEIPYLDEIRNSLKRAFRLKAIPKTSSVGFVDKQFDQFSKKQKSSSKVPQHALRIVKLLKDQNIRNAILRTRQAKDPTVENISKSMGLELISVKRILNRACSQNILMKQYNVICGKCSNVLARVPNKGSISKLAKENASCPACKTPVESASSETVYTVNPKYDFLVDGSKWMHLYVKQALEAFGIRKVLSEVKDGPNELDLVANLEGSLVLMELKDNRFSIGHAYSFIGKCSQYRPNFSFIVATQGIDQDVKEYVKNTKTEVNYIENIDDLETQFKEIFSTFFAKRLKSHISNIPWNVLMTMGLLRSFGNDLPMSEFAEDGFYDVPF